MKYGSTYHDLRARFQDRALSPETFFLLNSDDALEFLNAGRSVGLEFMGVDGFEITDTGAYRPRQDFSNDLADWHGSYDEFIENTKELFERGAAAGIRFEVVFKVT